MIEEPRASFPSRHRDLLIIAGLAIALAMVVGYNVWASQVSARNARTAAVARQADRKATRTATKVNRLSSGQCATTKLFYRLFNALAEDTSPSFGSPEGGPPIPGARDRLIGELYEAERASIKPLAAQGCKVPAPPS